MYSNLLKNKQKGNRYVQCISFHTKISANVKPTHLHINQESREELMKLRNHKPCFAKPFENEYFDPERDILLLHGAQTSQTIVVSKTLHQACFYGEYYKKNENQQIIRPPHLLTEFFPNLKKKITLFEAVESFFQNDVQIVQFHDYYNLGVEQYEQLAFVHVMERYNTVTTPGNLSWTAGTIELKDPRVYLSRRYSKGIFCVQPESQNP
ncbi:hypothetical protein BJ875DRAFT_441216 [Amylocarpus encephaloides]|uniref:Uncharacterized protein n=1 Tax=Amylocarpus encephaloides TaxID=45428 RepID=A0A9P7YIL1_9HELO|nr:hypothetical protein BJ875DRAFT_441216 [Amylocarpus encephaloides]